MQLAFYGLEAAVRYYYRAIDRFVGLNLADKILAVHMPLNAVELINENRYFREDLIKSGHKFSDRGLNYIIHPKEGIVDAVKGLRRGGFSQTLCIENFLWKDKKKELRGLLEISEFIIDNPWCRMCLDTSHTEEKVFEHGISRWLLDYVLGFTAVIHLSNRRIARAIKKDEPRSHRPFNDQSADLPLLEFVNNLIPVYKWNGVIILEYMPDFKDRIFKNLKYLDQLLEKSKKRARKMQKEKYKTRR